MYVCVCVQEQVSESTTKTVLDKLNPDTRYTIRVVPVYAEGDGPSLTDSGKTSESTQRGQGSEVRGPHTHTPPSTPRPPSCLLLPEPLGFARNLQVLDPTTSTLNVRWDPAEGNVREYIVIWVPASGIGEQEVVRLRLTEQVTTHTSPPGQRQRVEAAAARCSEAPVRCIGRE